MRNYQNRALIFNLTNEVVGKFSTVILQQKYQIKIFNHKFVTSIKLESTQLYREENQNIIYTGEIKFINQEENYTDSSSVIE